jgi:aerobic-type carbon monoxide dehydrogenase small subunit (CoxS/CutS family)
VRELALTVNGRSVREQVDDRLLLSDFLRHSLGLRGTHVGCEHGVCGACTVQVDGRAVRSCLMLAAQAEGCHVETVEALAEPEGPLSALQDAFRRHHALQCGFCTPGILMSAAALLEENARPTRDDIREALSGNLCRCTGYTKIIDAVEMAAATLRGEPTGSGVTSPEVLLPPDSVLAAAADAVAEDEVGAGSEVVL